jgi:hypothetical protein
MHMRFRKPSNSPGLGRYSLLCHGRSTALTERSAFLFLSWPLDELGWSVWSGSFCSLVSRVTSSGRAYLLAIASICFEVLRFFMASLRIKDEFLSPFLKNMIIDLSSTSGMRLLLLQQHRMNSRSDSLFFWTTLARSYSTHGRAHVDRKLLLNSRHRWVQERTDPEGSPRSHVLTDEDRQTSK